LFKICIERSKILENDKDIKLQKVIEYYENIRVSVAKGWAARYIGEILLNIDNQHIFEAEEWVMKAIELDEKSSAMWSLGSDYALYAELFRRKHEGSKVKECLKKAIGIFEESGADGWVKRYEEQLDSL
jgi:hypothetical protein